MLAAYSCAHCAAESAKLGVANNVSIIAIATATIDTGMTYSPQGSVPSLPTLLT
jgi:hypothetical protein